MSSPVPSRYVGPERIYRGGTADVYSALDRELGRKVAIKILADRSKDDAQARAWLRREAMAMARLSHVIEVVRVYDVGSWHGRPYMALEYLGGGSLAGRLQRGGVTGELALRWLWQAATALDAAHELGIVHRDATPHNLLLDIRDNLRLIDFGIATAFDGKLGADGPDELIQGTGGFIAPEHLAGEPVTPAVDVYGLGAVARVLLAAADDVHDRTQEVQAVLSRALASRPGDRFGTAREFVRELGSAMTPDSATTQVFHGAATQAFARPTRVFVPPEAREDEHEAEPALPMRTSPLLPVIAVERAVRAAAMIAVGLIAVLLRNHPDLSIRSTALRLDLALNPLQHFYDLFSGAVRWVSPRDFTVLGVVALVFGGIHAVEAIGLALRLRDAVYLSIATTVALIPVEVWWLSKHPGRLKEIALAVNVAVAVSLGTTLIHARLRARRAHAMAAARASV
jgi:serine/threonine protein kinase